MVQRGLTYQNHKWRQCSSLTAISRILFTLNSFHKARQSTKLIMWQYWNSYMKLCIEKGLNFCLALLGYVHSCSGGVLWRCPISGSCKYTGMFAIKSFRELRRHMLCVLHIALDNSCWEKHFTFCPFRVLISSLLMALWPLLCSILIVLVKINIFAL
jgi:hypothetical protein